jgi:predicted enzyme related to lactoylglutathione lyase
MERLKSFYELFDVAFQQEQHGKGPIHLSTMLPHGVVLEIYPLKNDSAVDSSLRLGFSVDDVDAIVSALRQAGHAIVTESRQTEWGYSAVVKDPDGRAVELQTAK